MEIHNRGGGCAKRTQRQGRGCAPALPLVWQPQGPPNAAAPWSASNHERQHVRREEKALQSKASLLLWLAVRHEQAKAEKLETVVNIHFFDT